MLVLVAALGSTLIPDLAQAATEAAASDTGEDVVQVIAELLSVVMQFLNALLWPVLIVIGDLMDTDLILGPGMEERLKGIWIPVRDLVNIGFVLVLLVVAFYNVLGIGGGEGDLALKTALPKIVLGLVVVNFTFIAGKVVLDLTNVATTAVFALPELAATDATPYDFSAVKTEFQVKVCYKQLNEDGSHDSWDADVDAEKDVPIYTRLFCDKDEETGTYDELDGLLAAKYFTDMNSNNIGLIMAVNMGGLSNLSILKADAIDSFEELTVSFLFSVMMYLVFATSYVVLGIVLITRLVVLWIALALSPLAVLTYVVPQIKEWTGGGGDFAQKILKHLMAPVIIGATMSLGYIMIAAWSGLAGNAALAGGGFQADQVISTEFLISGIDSLPQFIIAIASIVIVWTGVFAAASDTYASFATDAIKGFGERIRDAAVKAPTLLPTVPIGVKNGEDQFTSIAALRGLADQGLRNIEYGTGVDTEMQNLANANPIAKMLMGDRGARGTMDPVTNARTIEDSLAKRDGNGNMLSSDLSAVAKALYNTIDAKSSLQGSEKEALLKEVRELQTGYDNGSQRSFEPLKAILNRKGEELGILSGSTDSTIKESANNFNGEVVTTPATVQAPPTQAAITAARGSITALTSAVAAAETAGAGLTAAQLKAATDQLAAATAAVPAAADAQLTRDLEALKTRVEALPPAAAPAPTAPVTPPPATPPATTPPATTPPTTTPPPAPAPHM